MDSQKAYLSQATDITEANIRSNGDVITFFGTAMHGGLRGYYLRSFSRLDYSVGVFSIDLETGRGVPEIEARSVELQKQATSPEELDKPLTICMGNTGDVFVSTTSYSDVHPDGQDVVLRFRDLDDLWENLAYKFFEVIVPSRPQLGSFKVVQLCSNSTTVTALSLDAVYTSTRDPRYPQCLGRPYDGTVAFESVSYLSETNITKIASGGYMTAAISDEGELFLWGQACPGSAGDLVVLKGNVLDDRQSESKGTGISIEDEQDDFVKCLTVRIDGEAANVYDVAIGHGHILVAAEVAVLGSPVKRVVFAAGDSSKGQLGLSDVGDFVNDFEEISRLRGKKVEQLAAAGWSSLVVTREE
jgi:hypothetical protein